MKIYSVSHRDLDTSDIRKFVGKDIWVKVQLKIFVPTDFDFIRVTHISDDKVFFNRVSEWGLVNPAAYWPPFREDTVDRFLNREEHTYLHMVSICTPLDLLTTAEIREILLENKAT